jgi:hypothetical protein
MVLFFQVVLTMAALFIAVVGIDALLVLIVRPWLSEREP